MDLLFITEILIFIGLYIIIDIAEYNIYLTRLETLRDKGILDKEIHRLPRVIRIILSGIVAIFVSHLIATA